MGVEETFEITEPEARRRSYFKQFVTIQLVAMADRKSGGLPENRVFRASVGPLPRLLQFAIPGLFVIILANFRLRSQLSVSIAVRSRSEEG